jgi:hemin uptake protein HemP
MIVRSENDGAGAMHQGNAAPAAGRTITVSGNRLDSRQLFVSDREIIIAHGEDTYRLRLTSQNKLILTK